MLWATTPASFQTGDVLTLKSGGRAMTATWVGPVVFAPGNWLICQWFDGEGELCQEMFPETTLERAHSGYHAIPAVAH